MKKVTTRDASGGTERPDVFRPLSSALGATDLAINYVVRSPGEHIGDCYHRHLEQEEVFYVLSGTATFETEDGDVAVDSGELIRFAPGEWQQGRNSGDGRLDVLALGAPRDDEPIELRRDCPSCGERTSATREEIDGGEVFYCGECGTETGRYT